MFKKNNLVPISEMQEFVRDNAYISLGNIQVEIKNSDAQKTVFEVSNMEDKMFVMKVDNSVFKENGYVSQELYDTLKEALLFGWDKQTFLFTNIFKLMISTFIAACLYSLAAQSSFIHVYLFLLFFFISYFLISNLLKRKIYTSKVAEPLTAFISIKLTEIYFMFKP